MTTHTDDDLDQLLRRTLSGRAGTVGSGPQWTGAPDRRRSRTPWIAAAAAAVAVLGIAGGIAYLAPSADDDAPAGSGGTPVACRTALPQAWRDAVGTAAPLTADGHAVAPVTVTETGSVLGAWAGADRSEHIVLLQPDGTSRELAALPATRVDAGLDTDGTSVVLASSPQAQDVGNGGAPGMVDDIAVIDVATHAATAILAGTPTPAGWVVAGGRQAAKIQDGIVYWGMRPGGREDDITRTDIVSYTIRTGRYAIVARLDGAFSHDATNEVDRDIRGVGWTGGSVPAASVPAGLPGFRTSAGTYQQVVSDGRGAAWDLGAGNSTVHWTDGAGLLKTFSVQQPADPDNSVAVQAVSGPFVFLYLNSNRDGELVLDTRTGALAGTGLEAGAVDLASGHRVLLKNANRVPASVDIADLPELRC